MDNFTIKEKTLLFSAKRCSGKSLLIIRYLVGLYKHEFDKVFVCCPTESINRFYRNYVDDKCVFDGFSESWTEKLIENMTKVNSAENGEKKHILVIFDDCNSEEGFYKSPAIKKLFTRGRHIKISVIVSLQYLHLASPTVRSNADYVLCGQQNNFTLQILTEEYLFGNITKKDFIKMFHRNTADFQFLIINCNSVKNNNNLQSIYSVIKTPSEYLS